MDEEKVHFIHGNAELNIPGCIANGIPENIASEIWAKMEKFAEYAFNKSHAACYAALSMQTAYLKCHYGNYFLAGLISSVMDAPNKLPLYIQTAKKMGISISKPDINSSMEKFTVKDANTLLFGFGCVKGMSTEAAKTIIKERNTNGNFASMTDFTRRCNPKKNVLTSLIEIGALDFTGNTRQAMKAEVENLIKSIKKEQKSTQISGQMSLFEIAPDFKPDTTDRFAPMKEMKKLELLRAEKENVGYYISGHPLEQYVFKGCDNTYSIREKFQEEQVIVPGIITKVHKTFTKKDNKPMAIFEIEDTLGVVTCVAFPQVYEKLKADLQVNNIIIAIGKLSIEGGGEDEDKKFSILLSRNDHLLGDFDKIEVEKEITKKDLMEVQKEAAKLREGSMAFYKYKNIIFPVNSVNLDTLPSIWEKRGIPITIWNTSLKV